MNPLIYLKRICLVLMLATSLPLFAQTGDRPAGGVGGGETDLSATIEKAMDSVGADNLIGANLPGSERDAGIGNP